MDVILSIYFLHILYQKYHNMRFLKNIKKQKNLIEKVEVQGMLNLEGLLLKN